ncbi:EndoU domain-containing protein [Saccharopolyspora pogona]|uniref:EndoU domain-containing protein n=1 Tax=Saccharopolyspora pogona TaxID=333966 RepID=UPI0016861A9E|nr:EndoU domain-containing protein [Saccharopolyspora pogona]
MSAVEDVDKALSFVLGKLAEATEQLSTAQAALEEGGTGLSVLDGTNDDEAQQALVHQQESGDQLTHAQEVLRRCTEQIKQYQPRVATSRAPSTPPREPPARPDSRTRSSLPRPPQRETTHGRWFTPNGDAARQRSVEQTAEPTAWDNVEGEKPNPADIHTPDLKQIHILDGEGDGKGGHVAGTGNPGKTEFPKAWDDDKIIDTVEDVAKNPDSPPTLEKSGNYKFNGTRDGVEIEGYVTPGGQVQTGYPVRGKGVMQNDEFGNPHPVSSSK